jgi:hypothetical protein
MPSNIVTQLIEKVNDMALAMESLKTDMLWLKRFAYCGIGAAITQVVVSLLK